MNDNPASDGPTNQPTEQGWQAVVDDMAATAEAYRDRGWTTLELHPGDSVLVDSEFRTGLDVLLPGDEYEDLEALAEDTAFTDVDVFQAAANSTTYLLVVEKDPDSETAVFVPAYYDSATSAEKLDTIRANGEVRLFCRRLNDDYVEFVHENVDPFLPEQPDA
ncbi:MULTISPECIES: DUF7529 family protein [unclassified Halobacterium]|jgi:hypothetical protein|uniref:DUF7529 family protein n=1 Tax=unclassified Halobacterium TaxID=2668073 RepID=UPI001E49D60E|nr:MULTISPECIES: hypothetical protein [unclassified Halobacterium]MCD2200199.1 hypothetical protein [Halobacterium sp. KA-4]MCD2203265.1 hypothetical protein [Halobacterium sp. KA-6]